MGAMSMLFEVRRYQTPLDSTVSPGPTAAAGYGFLHFSIHGVIRGSMGPRFHEPAPEQVGRL